ncbi:hypothetical protein MTO96_013122 [Rhipicephalus appendiculatus]
MPQMAAIRKKLVIIRDGQWGKTCLLIVFNQGLLTEACLHPTFENCVTAIDDQVEVALWDTAGREDNERLRPLSYQDRCVILMCFSIDSPDLLTFMRFSIDSPDFLKNNTESGEARGAPFCPNVSIIVAGNKSLRNGSLNLPEPAMKQKNAAPEERRAVA